MSEAEKLSERGRRIFFSIAGECPSRFFSHARSLARSLFLWTAVPSLISWADRSRQKPFYEARRIAEGEMIAILLVSSRR